MKVDPRAYDEKEQTESSMVGLVFCNPRITVNPTRNQPLLDPLRELLTADRHADSGRSSSTLAEDRS